MKEGIRMHTHKKEQGAVSLFIVVFAALLITVVTVSFTRIMIRDQQQATTVDLSQSAYDSAQVGTEDAKRALLRFQSACQTDGPACVAAKAQMDQAENTCNIGLAGIDIVADADKEIKVQQDLVAGKVELDQAYTCVKIKLKTDDYLGSMSQDASALIPLVGESTFDSVRVEWFNSKDLQGTTATVNVPSFTAGSPPLLDQSSWTTAASQNRPSVVRTQLMQFGSGGFSLADFDGGTNTSGVSNANTLFLYPSDIAQTTKSFAGNTRQSPTAAPTQATCKSSLGSQDYACSATITLPTPINAGSRTAYLRLTALYKNTHYKLTLLNAGSTVRLDGVQPEIDSTGRANDLFRRVQSRVEVVDVNFPYPDTAVDITGNFCKNFLITNNAADYNSAGCTP